MKEWFSASELEDVSLPGLPKYRQHITRKANQDGWKSRPREGRGGGNEYHVSSLPEEARLTLLARMTGEGEKAQEGQIVSAKLELSQRMEERARRAPRQESLAELTGLSEAARTRMDARLEMVDCYERFLEHAGLPKTRLWDHLERLYAERELELSEAAYEELGATISGRSVDRWKKKIDKQGVAALAGKYGKRSERDYETIIDSNEEMQQLVLGMIRDNPHANARHVRRAMLARFDRDEVPHVRTVQRYIEMWHEKNGQLAEYIANPDAWRSRYQTAFGSASEHVTALNQVWELDSTPGDVMLEGGRHSIIGAIDVYTRRLKLHVAKTSTAAGIASLLRRSLLDWGIPKSLKMDNGTDYKSKHIRRITHGLAIEADYVPPFSPEKKPHIERAFGTFTRDLVELLPGYIGHDVAERKAIEARKSFADRLLQRGEAVEVAMTAEDFQAFCDDWCESVYAREPHGGLNGKSPFQMAAGWRQPVRRIENERALDVLLAPAPGGDGIRTVRKKGLQISNLYYQAPELTPHVGQQVLVLYDEADAGRVYVFGGDDMAFLCVAECPEITGVSRKELAVEARRYQKRAMREAKKELDAAARGASTADIWREIVDKKAEAAAKVHRMPEQTEEHTTEHLEAAGEADKARRLMDVPQELRTESEPAVKAEIKRLRSADRRREEERPSYFDNEWHRYTWIRKQAKAGRYHLLIESDWELVGRIEQDEDIEIPESKRVPRPDGQDQAAAG